jgi:hypothetical protein
VDVWHTLTDVRREGRGARRWKVAFDLLFSSQQIEMELAETRTTPFLPIVSQGVPPEREDSPQRHKDTKNRN